MSQTENKTNILSILITFTFISCLVFAAISFYNYIANIPKKIDAFTYSNNILEFKIENDEKLYKLKLPSFAKISNSDQLSINMHESHIRGVSLNPKVISNPSMVDKKIELYINDKLSYNTNNNLELSYVFKDPDTGLVVEKEFK